MSQTLELPDELYEALMQAADARGLTPIDWIAGRLVEVRGKKEGESDKMSHARTLADLFVGRIGRIRSGGKERLSEECGTKFTEFLEEKRRSGHL